MEQRDRFNTRITTHIYIVEVFSTFLLFYICYLPLSYSDIDFDICILVRVCVNEMNDTETKENCIGRDTHIKSKETCKLCVIYKTIFYLMLCFCNTRVYLLNLS